MGCADSLSNGSLKDQLTSGWRAQLDLDFAKRAARTVLSGRTHSGPLLVQKPLYPEGDAVCHVIVVHPPAGIVGGDELQLTAHAQTNAHALLTTPGATKWYRSAGPRAYQHIRFSVASGACVEWLPQEGIVFDGALAELRMDVQLFGDACYIGWEILCLGRAGAGERFTKGEYLARTVIERDGKSIWLERAQLQGGSPALASPVVMAGQSVAGTFIAASSGIEAGLLELCRGARPLAGSGAVTAMPGLFVGRYLGASSEAAKNYFAQLWRVVRPALAGRSASEPRIWRT
jgi:urease accessory protein